MATAEELLAASEPANKDKILIIDADLRTIAIPSDFGVFGVEFDDDVHRVHFRGPRFYHGVDLSTFDLRINIKNADGEPDLYEITDLAAEENAITFSWLIGRFVARSKGYITFAICFRELTETGEVLREFNTTTATGQILEGLEVGKQMEWEYPNVVENILARLKIIESGNIPLDYSKLPDSVTLEEIVDTQLVAPTASTCWYDADYMPECSITACGYLFPGEIYTVVFDGVTYKSPLKTINLYANGELEIANVYIIGNAEIIRNYYNAMSIGWDFGVVYDPVDDEYKTDEPFAIFAGSKTYFCDSLVASEPYSSSLDVLAGDTARHEFSMSGKALRLRVQTNTIILPMSTVRAGGVFRVNAGGLAERCWDGDNFDGVCVSTTADNPYMLQKANCQIDGIAVVSFTGQLSSGRVKLVADDYGGVRLDRDNGREYLILHHDNDAKKVVLRL